MHLKDFIDQFSKNSLETTPTLFFSYDAQTSLSTLFISQLIECFKQKQEPVESLVLTEQSLSEIIGKLETSFLGMSRMYWLRGFSEIEKKYRQNLLQYSSSYQGPHRILMFVPENEIPLGISKHSIIEIPSLVNSALLISLATIFTKKITPSMIQTLKSLETVYNKISLDQACIIITYLQVIGKNNDLNVLLEEILGSEKSLFKLSTYFFSKDASSFFKYWQLYADEYPMPFWCTFWGDQLWRAYYVYYFLERKQYQQAKAMGFRLPFSYMQKDWKKTTLQELKKAHQIIYELDNASKNSLETSAGIDLFYNKFFLNEFR